VFSAHAERVDVCLFDTATGKEQARYRLSGRTEDIWHGFLPQSVAGPGTLYGFRAHGPFAPREGHRFNPNKLLIDPCALDVAGELLPAAAVDDDPHGGPLPLDSAPFVPKGRVVAMEFDWQDARSPAVPWRDTVIYELHVKGFTQLHPEVPRAWRGKYLGLTVPAVIEHLKSLGVTAVELLPCHAFASEPFLQQRGLTNYWGYNPFAWFAPARQYAVVDPVLEFRQMVRALHQAGIEVILDVVLNHTAEGGGGGRTFSLKGLDNASYYWLDPADPSAYLNYAGCGNTVDAGHPAARALILDCLRYWAQEMRVDGFRFDLATVLARREQGFDPDNALFGAIRSDPVLAYAKMIAEPWDLGPGGYRLGGFPTGWSEWNDRYRDTVRAFWRGDAGQVPALAERLAGSSDLFRRGGRRPQASVNFVTAHDGFSLADLVSYERRHNEANLEGNADGHAENFSWNCGVEGPTTDAAIAALRERQMRNLLATLLLSQGVPMIQAGDELARSQGGNNNAYCQDNVTSWIVWPYTGPGPAAGLRAAIAALTALRRRRPEFRRDRFFKGSPRGARQADVRWLHPDGRDMQHSDWADPVLRALGMLLRTEDEGAGDLLLLLSSRDGEIPFRLPGDTQGRWRACIDTSVPDAQPEPAAVGPDITLPPRSVLVLERVE
jgi:glycogen operon protein